MTTPRMDAFTRAYFEVALWSSSDESDDSGGEPLDKNYGISDFDPATRDKMIADCADFQNRAEGMLLMDDSPQIEKWGRDALAGHDFWLTRNGHGAGFWDGDWPTQGDALTDLSKEYGEFNLYLGDPDEDGERLIYGTPLDAHVSERHHRGVVGASHRSARHRGVVREPQANARWTVQAGRGLVFDGRLFAHLDKEGTNTAPVEADGAVILIADLFNQNGVTPDTIYEGHMGRPRRRR